MTHFLILCALLVPLTSVAADKKAAPDTDDITTALTQELKLDEQQSQKMRAAMEKFGAQLDKLFEEQESKDTDPEKFINGIKQAQDAHNKELQNYTQQGSV